MVNNDEHSAFRLSGSVEEVVRTLKALVELEWEFPHLAAQLTGKLIQVTPGMEIEPSVVGSVFL